jgi:hypothetical protein
MAFKKVFEKIAYVTSNIAETSIKKHIYHYTIPRETVIF